MPEAPPRAPLVTDAIPPRLRRTGTTPGGVLLMCVIGTLVLGFFASRDLSSWTERLENPPLHRLAALWDETMDDAGLTRPQETLRAASAWAQGLDWSGGPAD